MRVVIKVVPAGTIADYDNPNYQLTSYTSDTEAVKEYFGNRPSVAEFDAFLIRVEGGDYADVLGFHGEMPGVGKQVWRITRTFVADKAKKKPAKRRATKSARPGTSLGGVR